MVARAPAAARIIAATVRASRRRSGWGIARRKAATLALVGLVLGSAIDAPGAEGLSGSEVLRVPD